MDHSFTQQISVFMMCQAQGKEQSADTEDSVGDCGAPCLWARTLNSSSDFEPWPHHLDTVLSKQVS